MRSLYVVLLTVVATSSALAQRAPESTLLVLRSQIVDVLEEAWPRLTDSVKAPGEITVVVDGASAKRIVENAVVEFLDRREVRAHLWQQGEQSETLVVTVLEQVAQFTMLQNGNFRRELRTAIEFRRSALGNSRVFTTGPVRRSVVDTVTVKDDGGIAELGIKEEESFVEKVLGPVVLIGGAFLVIYLFFTVRN